MIIKPQHHQHSCRLLQVVLEGSKGRPSTSKFDVAQVEATIEAVSGAARPKARRRQAKMGNAQGTDTQIKVLPKPRSATRSQSSSHWHRLNEPSQPVYGPHILTHSHLNPSKEFTIFGIHDGEYRLVYKPL